MALEKKEFAKAKADFELHVQLLARVRSLTPAQARVVAWMEGPSGLVTLLAGVPASGSAGGQK